MYFFVGEINVVTELQCSKELEMSSIAAVFICLHGNNVQYSKVKGPKNVYGIVIEGPKVKGPKNVYSIVIEASLEVRLSRLFPKSSPTSTFIFPSPSLNSKKDNL
jgi:hypothetical protein